MIARRMFSRLAAMFAACSAVIVLTVCVQAGSSLRVTTAAGGPKAADLASAAEEMVKSFETKVASDAAFKAGVEDIAKKAPVLAVIANAVATADGEAAWKSKALGVRDAALVLAKAKARPAAEKAVKEIKELFGGGGAAAGDAKPAKPLDLADLELVMKDVSDRNRDLNKTTKVAARNKEAIAREANVISLFGSVARQATKPAEKMKKPQADYEKFADDLIATADALAAAAKTGEQGAVKDAFTKFRATCSACHAVFKPDAD